MCCSARSEWLYIVPWGMRDLLKWVKDTYNNPRVIITESGMSDPKEGLDDKERIDYLRRYINNVLKGKGATI